MIKLSRRAEHIVENNQLENAAVSLTQSIDCCQKVVVAYDRAFYWGSLLMPWQKRWVMWSVYAWFRLKDEHIDGPEPLETKKKLRNELSITVRFT